MRIAGTDLSGYARDVDEVVFESVRRLALQRKAKPWMPLDVVEMPDNRHPELHFLTDEARKSNSLVGNTVLWWRFRHKTLPIEAAIVVSMTGNHAGQQSYTASVWMPLTSLDHAQYGRADRATSVDSIGDHRTFLNGDHLDKFREFKRDNADRWQHLGEALKGLRTNELRTFVATVLRNVRKLEDVESFEIPDLRNPAKMGWLTLELHDTNVTGSFLQSMADYLDGGPAVERAHNAYVELLAALRDLGVVLPPLDENQFMAAIAGPAEAVLNVELGRAHQEGGRDYEHQLSLHLVSGTFVVSCSAKTQNIDPDKVALEWERASAIAELTGKESELLAYARRYALHQQAELVETTIRKRSVA